MPAAHRNTKKSKRTDAALTGASVTEPIQRTQVMDRLHMAYSQSVPVGHLTVKAKRKLGLKPDADTSSLRWRG